MAFPGSDGEPFPALTAIVRAYASGGPKNPILILGDSVMERVSRHDRDTRPLGEMMVAALKQPALCVTRSAFNPAIYHALAAVLARAAAAPKQVVIPVNLRCFSPQWDLHPAWQLKQELAAVEGFLGDMTSRIPAIDDVIEGPDFFLDYDAARVNCPLSLHSTAGEFRRLIQSAPDSTDKRDERAREIFNFHYAFALSKDNRKLLALVQCVQLLAKTGCSALAYLTPINVDAGTSLAGAEWRSALSENVRFVLAALGNAGAASLRIRDWSEAFSSAHFFHEDLATEHLNEQGRAVLADLVAAELEAGESA